MVELFPVKFHGIFQSPVNIGGGAICMFNSISGDQMLSCLSRYNNVCCQVCSSLGTYKPHKDLILFFREENKMCMWCLPSLDMLLLAGEASRGYFLWVSIPWSKMAAPWAPWWLSWHFWVTVTCVSWRKDSWVSDHVYPAKILYSCLWSNGEKFS